MDAFNYIKMKNRMTEDCNINCNKCEFYFFIMTLLPKIFNSNAALIFIFTIPKLFETNLQISSKFEISGIIRIRKIRKFEHE